MSVVKPRKIKILIIIIILMGLTAALRAQLAAAYKILDAADGDYANWTTEQKELGGLVETIHADAVDNELDSGDMASYESDLDTALANC